jgi:hypothetical protein
LGVVSVWMNMERVEVSGARVRGAVRGEGRRVAWRGVCRGAVWTVRREMRGRARRSRRRAGREDMVGYMEVDGGGGGGRRR